MLRGDKVGLRARHEDDIPILQIETLSDNAAMLRSAAWVLGEFLDEVVLGLLAQDWKTQAAAAEPVKPVRSAGT